MHVHGSVAVLHDGTEVFLEPGDIVFCDQAPFDSSRSCDQFRMTVFQVPRRLLRIAESDLRRVIGVPLHCAEGVGALASHFLSVLATDSDIHRSHIGDRFVGNVVEILAALVTESIGANEADVSDGGAQTLSRIRTFIELHLADPDLSPQSIALAHHISVRYLHKLFESEGTTVSQWIRRRRLEACRHELGRAPRRRLTVAGVAHRWGFVSPSHFSRAFRDAYGMSPTEWQSSVSSTPGGPHPARSPGGLPRPAAVIASPVGGATSPAAALRTPCRSVPTTSGVRVLCS